MATKDQLPLFDAPRVAVAPRVRAATPSDAIVRCAAALPSCVRLGATSWTTPQWDGLVWERPQPKPVLAREGIGPYAAHPLLRTVLLDSAAGLRPDTAALAMLAACVPEDFRFVLAADEAMFYGQLPAHRRFGDAAGGPNPWFFSVETMVRTCVEPFVHGLGPRGGVVLIAIPSQSPRSLGTRKAFPDRLHRFLRELPVGPQYAVELRDHKLLTEPYAAAVTDCGAVHCMSVHASMPDLATQLALAPPSAPLPLLIRWSGCVHFDYRAAARNYAPYDALVERDPAVRAAVASMLRELAGSNSPGYLLVDNMAEGCAPASIAEVALLLTE